MREGEQTLDALLDAMNKRISNQQQAIAAAELRLSTIQRSIDEL